MLNHHPQENGKPLQRAVIEAIVNAGTDASCEDLHAFAAERRQSQEESSEKQRWHRWQDPVIEELIAAQSSVLDIGCGDGELLERLIRTKRVCAQGVEVDDAAVLRCIERGVPVFHGDVDEGLGGFPDQSVDVVVLEETLQTLRRPIDVLEEMMRVGHRSIVSFPNFAHWQVRTEFSLGGRMPMTETLPNRWYDTPNIHLCSIRDFLDWTVNTGVRVLDAHVLVDDGVRRLREGDNLRAAEALFVVDRPATD